MQKSNLLDSAKTFLINEKPSAQEINIFRDLFYTLVGKTSAGDLEAISRILARSVFTPRPIAMYLAMEPLDIAAPFLLISPVLNDSDLIAISGNRMEGYVEVIARRDNLSQRLRDHLESLDTNISDLKAIKPEITSPPLTEPVKGELVSASRAESTKSDASKSSSQKPKDLSAQLVALANKGGKIERKRNSEVVIPNPADLEATALHLLREGQHMQFAEMLARKTGLDRQLLLDYVTLDDIGKLAALYRALHFTSTMSIRLLLLTSSNLGRSPGVFNQIAAMFEQLDISECQKQFIALGANFTAKPQAKTQTVDAPHFTSLVAERRRSVQMPGRVDQQPSDTRKSFGQRSTGT